MLYNHIYKEHNILGELSEQIKPLVDEIYQGSSLCHVDINNTSQLIAQYIDYNFLPIRIKEDRNIHYYLYNMDGQYVEQFNTRKDMLKYIDQEISRNHLSCDMLRLY